MPKPVAGPNPDPRRPILELPAGSCDSHCHVFGPVARFPFFEGRSYTPPDVPFERYTELMDRMGFDRSVIVQPSIYGTDNRCTEDAVRRLGDNGRGVSVIAPDIPLAELRRMTDAGFRGARLNLYHAGGSTPLEDLESIARRGAEVAWHTQVYVQGPQLPDLLPRLMNLPTPVVLDHLAHLEFGKGLDQPGFGALIKLMETGNVWVKLCPYRFDLGGAPYIEAGRVARALYEVAPNRLVWGTDWPHPDIAGPDPLTPGPMPDDGDLVDALGEWFGNGDAIHRIMVDNPVELYGFGP